MLIKEPLLLIVKSSLCGFRFSLSMVLNHMSDATVCGMMHIKELLLIIGKKNPCGGSGFRFSLSMVLNHMSRYLSGPLPYMSDAI